MDHVVPTLPMLIEQTEVQPCAGGAMAGLDGSSVFSLSLRKIFLLLCDSCIYPMRFGGIQLAERACLLLGLVASTADNSRRLQIKLRQIGPRLHVARTQVHCGFKLARHATRQPSSSHKAGFVGLLSVDAPKPEVKFAVFRRQRNGLFAIGNSAVPFPEAEISAAE